MAKNKALCVDSRPPRRTGQPPKWMRRCVVIAGARWVHFPEVKGEAAARVAAMPGSRHIDDELIAELKAAREARRCGLSEAAEEQEREG